MKRINISLLIILVLITSLALPACSPQAGSGKVRIAVVLPSTIDDLAWSQGMYEGLMAVQKELGADKIEIAKSERLSSPVDAGAAVRQYASQGFDLVIAHGSQFQSVLDEVAKDFPKTSFAYGTGFKSHDNVFAYDPQAQEGAYLLGILAGKITKTNKIGIVGPVASGDAIKYNAGFEQGVKSVNPKAEVRIAYTGGFGDNAKAAELAKAHMDAGADVLTGTAQQAVAAITAAKERPGVIWLGNDMDQSSLAPDTVMAAQTYDWKGAVKQMIESRKNGKLGGETITLSLAKGSIAIVYNAKMESKVAKDVKDAMEAAKKDIVAGKLTIALPK